VSVLVSGDARAGGFGVPELGARRTGMAATIGRPDEPSAVFHNPAGLTLQPGLRLYISMGLALVRTSFQLRPWEQSEEYLDDPVDGDGYYPATSPTRALAVIPMLVATYEVVPDRWFAALSLYVNNATGAKFARDGVTRYHLINGYIVSPLLEASGAYRIGPRLSVGAGLGMMNVRVHGHRELYPIVNGSDLSVLLGSNAELTLDGSDWVPSWRLGVLGTPLPGLTLGAAVIGRADPVLSGPITIAYGDDAPAPDTVLRGTAHTSLVLPWTFHAGGNYDVARQVEVGAELRYYLYRQYEEQHTRIDDIFLIDELTTVKNYRDSYQVSGGVRVHDLGAAPGLELMLGGHYDRTPAPAQTVTLDQPTFSHLGLHTGVRWSRGRYRLGATYLRYFYDVPTTDDSITMPPSNIRGHGSNHIMSLSLEAALGDAR
jgi:long-subunit fatty acid transport protein